MKSFIITIYRGLLVATFFASCFPSNEYFEDINEQPSLFLVFGGDTLSSISDKHKLSSSNKEYYFNYSFSDDQPGAEFSLSQIQGKGLLNFNETTKILSYSPSDIGQHKFNIVCTDIYGLSQSVEVNLEVFYNYKPVAYFDYSVSNTLLTIDASNSYDPDSLFGGKIIKYKFNVNGKVYEKTSPKFQYNVINGMYYYVQLTVFDNDLENNTYDSGIQIE